MDRYKNTTYSIPANSRTSEFMCAPRGLVADPATDWIYCWCAIQSLGDFGYVGLVADLATDWMYYWRAVQSLGDFGYRVRSQFWPQIGCVAGVRPKSRRLRLQGESLNPRQGYATSVHLNAIATHNNPQYTLLTQSISLDDRNSPVNVFRLAVSKKSIRKTFPPKC
jgi:hypothetical protein